MTYSPSIALVRGVPRSFAHCLKEKTPVSPIDPALAARQHEAYVSELRKAGLRVVELPADERFPDCCFVEDTAVVIGDKALINRLGAEERRGEQTAIRSALEELRRQSFVDLVSPGTLDGGDVLFTGQHVLVGLSRRTNLEGARQLEGVFGDQFPVWTVPVEGALHLKSVMSAFAPGVLLFAGSSEGRQLRSELEKQHGLSRHYECVETPDTPSSNVLTLGSTILIQAGYPRSQKILEDLAARHQKTLVALTMSELIKADGALTCCSILI